MIMRWCERVTCSSSRRIRPSLTWVRPKNGLDTLEQLRTQEWDLLLMDLQMPDRSGLDILKEVTTDFPALRVLIVSGLPEEQYARNVLRAGASGYLSKGGSPAELLKAVRTVLMGRRYVSATLAESMAADPRVAGRPERAAPHPAVDARVPDFLQSGRRFTRDGHRSRIEPEREDREHLSQPYHGKNALQLERRHHELCSAQWPDRLTPRRRGTR